MGLFEFLELVGRVNQDSICLIRVHMNVDIGRWDCL
jgi:hypothetical protein